MNQISWKSIIDSIMQGFENVFQHARCLKKIHPLTTLDVRWGLTTTENVKLEKHC